MYSRTNTAPASRALLSAAARSSVRKSRCRLGCRTAPRVGNRPRLYDNGEAMPHPFNLLYIPEDKCRKEPHTVLGNRR
jgi:hypothetical protein